MIEESKRHTLSPHQRRAGFTRLRSKKRQHPPFCQYQTPLDILQQQNQCLMSQELSIGTSNALDMTYGVRTVLLSTFSNVNKTPRALAPIPGVRSAF